VDLFSLGSCGRHELAGEALALVELALELQEARVAGRLASPRGRPRRAAAAPTEARRLVARRALGLQRELELELDRRSVTRAAGDEPADPESAISCQAGSSKFV